MNEPLYFIQPHILDRLRSGQFVPERSSQLGALRDPPGPERRVTVSPLAVAKRCIRYEPLVFFNRLPELFLLAEALNPPMNGQVPQKLILLDGPSGCGKTTLMRGIVELMGGGPEQLLWIELTSLSDPDRVIQFMFQQLMKQAQNRILNDNLPEEADPLHAIAQLLKALPDWPVLIVMDKVQFFVSPGVTPVFVSPLLKDALNFLLAFPQIKLVLIGDRLPTADLSPNHPACFYHRVQPLPPQAALTLLKAALQKGTSPHNILLENLHQGPHSFDLFWCLPEPLRFLGKLSTLPALQKTGLFITSQLPSQTPHDFLKECLRSLWAAMTDDVKALLGFLTLLQHPVEVSALAHLMQLHAGHGQVQEHSGFNLLSPQPLDGSESIRQLLKNPLLSPLLRYGLSPQYALVTLEADGDMPTPSPILYKPLFMSAPPMVEPATGGIAQHIAYQIAPWLQSGLHTRWVESYSLEDRAAFHQTVSRFYQQQANNTLLLTSSQTSPEKLLSEARHHEAQARLLLQGMGLNPSFSQPLFIPDKSLERSILAAVSPPKAEGSWSIRSYLAQKAQ